MKKIYLVRHAKSSWDHSELKDHDRPLNKRGKRDAPFMASILKKAKIFPELIYTSTAERALSTAEIFIEELNIPKDDLIKTSSIYEAGIKEIERIIHQSSDEYSSIMLFGHNPVFTIYANHLGDKYIDNMPTCSIVGIECKVDKWEEIERGKGKTFLFEYPKKYFNDSE